jgi:predicted nucleic-acid-binding protein
MKDVIVDTNAFLRFLLNDIPQQKNQVEKLFKQAKMREIVINVPLVVIFEIHFALEKLYRFDKETSIEKLEAILKTDYFHIESREIILQALTFYRTYSVSFVDCFLLSKAKEEKAELFTFDQKLQKLS